MARTRSGPTGSDHLPRSPHEELQARPARRRRRSCRFDAGRGSVQRFLSLRRQSDRLGLLQAGRAARRRTVHDQSRPGLGDRPREQAGSHRQSVEHAGRDELRAGRRARDEPSGRTADSTDRVRRADRDASADVHGTGTARSERDLLGVRRRQRLLLSVGASPGRPSDPRAGPSRARLRCSRPGNAGRDPRRRRRAVHLRVEPPRPRTHAERHRIGAGRVDLRADSLFQQYVQRHAGRIARAGDPPQYIRVLQRGPRQPGDIRHPEHDDPGLHRCPRRCCARRPRS